MPTKIVGLRRTRDVLLAVLQAPGIDPRVAFDDQPYDFLGAGDGLVPCGRDEAVEPVGIIDHPSPSTSLPGWFGAAIFTPNSCVDILALFTEDTLPAGFADGKGDVPELDVVRVPPYLSTFADRVEILVEVPVDVRTLGLHPSFYRCE